MKKISIAGPELKDILNSENAKKQIVELFNEMPPFEIFSLIEGLETHEISQIIEYLRFPRGAQIF